MLALVDQHRLGDLELDQARVYIVPDDLLAKVIGNIAMVELDRRQVDSNADIQPLLPPVQYVLADLSNDPFTQRNDQSIFFCRADESARQHQALQGIVPAQQCFDADHPAVARIDDRLVMQIEFAAFQAKAQTPFQVSALVRIFIPFRYEKPEIIAFAMLHPVHRRIGALNQQIEGIAILREQADTDRRRQP